MQPALGRSNAGAVLAWLEKYKHHADASLLRNSHGECACTPKFDAAVTIEMYHVTHDLLAY